MKKREEDNTDDRLSTIQKTFFSCMLPLFHPDMPIGDELQLALEACAATKRTYHVANLRSH